MEKTFEQWLDAVAGVCKTDGLDFDRPEPDAPAEYAEVMAAYDAGQTPQQYVDAVWEEIENFHG